MRTIHAALLVSLGLVGCVPEPPLDPERGMVIDLWTQVFQGPGAAPIVEWIEGAQLDCDGGHGPNTGWLKPGTDRCRDGSTRSRIWIQVARWDSMTLAESALSHELGHVLSLALDPEGDGDPEHVSPAFQPGGAVQQGEAWLAQCENSQAACGFP